MPSSKTSVRTVQLFPALNTLGQLAHQRRFAPWLARSAFRVMRRCGQLARQFPSERDCLEAVLGPVFWAPTRAPLDFSANLTELAELMEEAYPYRLITAYLRAYDLRIGSYLTTRDRRYFSRRPDSGDAQLIVGDRTLPAFLRNRSPGGLGLTAPQLPGLHTYVRVQETVHWRRVRHEGIVAHTSRGPCEHTLGIELFRTFSWDIADEPTSQDE